MMNNQSSPDSFTDITKTSWVKRLAGSVVGFFFGLILLIVIPYLLWLNEGHEVKYLKALSFAEQHVVTASPITVDTALNGKLVYLTGDLSASAPPQDTLFGITAEGQARLQRHVEMFQWQEESHSESQNQFGGGMQTVTTYAYEKVWSDSQKNSGNFHHPQGHANPQMPFTTTDFDAPNLHIAAYTPDRGFGPAPVWWTGESLGL